MDKIFSVEELAKASNTTARAVRLYIDKGLLHPMRIGRMHCFTENAPITLKNILRAKRLGFSLDEIKACQTEHDTKAMNAAIKRIERLITDAENEVSDIRHRLAQSTDRR